MRFFLDENLSPQLTRLFQECGHDAVCANDVGMGGQNDAMIREYALQHDRILVTLDADFADLMRYPVAGTPGIVWLKLKQPITFSTIEQQLQQALIRLRDIEIRDRLIVIEQNRMRVRTGLSHPQQHD
jgi:predicted nuclease of predicted toxin-antitoxin system